MTLACFMHFCHAGLLIMVRNDELANQADH